MANRTALQSPCIRDTVVTQIQNPKLKKRMIKIAIIAFVMLWIWLIWEIVTAPVMPDDYDDRMKE